jgi:hypothetical protein
LTRGAACFDTNIRIRECETNAQDGNLQNQNGISEVAFGAGIGKHSNEIRMKGTC